ncbi:MAG: hypothetical protein ACKO4M_07110 [Betaproteobacteria bacterium]
MEKIILDEKAWSHTLYKHGSHYVLSVPCGGTAVYELDIPIDEATAETALQDPSVLELLASSIRQNPEAYLAKTVGIN